MQVIKRHSGYQGRLRRNIGKNFSDTYAPHSDTESYTRG